MRAVDNNSYFQMRPPFKATPVNARHVGIVYSTKNKHMRRHVYVEDDALWPQIEASLLPGESLAYVPMSYHHAGHDVFHQAIADAIGVPTKEQLFTDPRCVVIDETNTVVDVIMADADIDIHPMTLVNHAEAVHGDKWDSVSRKFTRASHTLPAKEGLRSEALLVPERTFD